MNLTELVAAAFGDSHREDYVTAHSARFVAEAESYIFAKLEAYGLIVNLTDADRVIALDSEYNLPSKTVQVRKILYNYVPLDQRDETYIGMNRAAQTVHAYVVRPRTLVFAGVPAAAAILQLHYWGLPPALVSGTDTNTLLNEYPQLYKRAIQIPIYLRAENIPAKQEAETDVVNLISEINRKIKKQIAGAEASNPYNVTWRSSF
jgi:hypothetical protein